MYQCDEFLVVKVTTNLKFKLNFREKIIVYDVRIRKAFMRLIIYDVKCDEALILAFKVTIVCSKTIYIYGCFDVMKHLTYVLKYTYFICGVMNFVLIIFQYFNFLI